MGQASSDLSTEEVDDSAPPTLGIGSSLRRRRVLPRLDSENRSESGEGLNNEEEHQQRPDGRSTGGGRYNLRVRPTTTNDNTAMSDRNNSEPENDETSPDAQESTSQRRSGTSDGIQIGVRRQGSSILRVERATLRSVLAVLTGRYENEEEDSDESEAPRGRGRRGLRRFDGMRMHNQNENDDGSSSGSATSDDEEWVRRIAGLSRGASFTRRRRNSSKTSRRTLRVDADMLQVLHCSDFSALTRKSLGMSPYPKQDCEVMNSKFSNLDCKLASYMDKCRRSVEKEDSETNVDIETTDSSIVLYEKEENSESGECSKSSRNKRQCSASPCDIKPNIPESSFRSSITSISEFNRLPTVSSWVSSRELGNFARSYSSGSPFSHGRQCVMMTKFLPNKRRKIATFNQKLFCGTYSNDGNLFLSACQDQNIRIFDCSQGKFHHRRMIRARNVGWSVLDTSLSPDNRHLIYSSWCDYIYQVNLYGPDGQMIRNDRLHANNDDGNTLEDNHLALNLAARDGGDRFCIFSMRFSQDGDEILCGAKDGYIYVYDRGSNQRSLRVDAHDDDVNAVAFIDSATHILASGGDDGVCKIWDRRALRETDPVPVGLLAGHIDGITYIDPKGDGRHLITNR